MCKSTLAPTSATNGEALPPIAEKLIGILNGGGLAMMISIGHRTGLFDAMAQLPPATPHEIAVAAGLQERYVREWLGAMATGGIVELDAASGTYALPAEHAAFLTRAASPDNFAVSMQFVSVLGGVEDRIVECFREGGGVHYSEYPRFHETMLEESDQTVVAALSDTILPLAPGLTERLEAGIDVLDVGCGSGLALLRLAEAFPQSRFTGFDFSEEAIGRARVEAGRRGLANASFEVQDVAAFDLPERFDLVTAFDAIHDQARPAEVLRRIRDALRPRGTFLMQDIAGRTHVHENLDHPVSPFLYTISTMHCMTVSLALDGEGLGTMWGREKALEMLGVAGFGPTELHQLPHDIMNYFYVVERDAA